MKITREMTTKSIILSVLLFFWVSVATACSCKPVKILENQKSSDVVFTGKIIGKREITDKNSDNYKNLGVRDFVYTFKVNKIHKGRKTLSSKKEIELKSGDNYSFCDVEFELNTKYIVYAYRSIDKSDKAWLQTDVCTRTRTMRFFKFLEQILLEFT